MSDLRQMILQVARANQLLLHPAALAPLAAFAAAEGGADPAQRHASLVHVFNVIQERRSSDAALNPAASAASKQVTAEVVTRAVDHLRGAPRGGGRAGATDAMAIRVVGAADVPQLVLDESRYHLVPLRERLTRLTALRQRYFLLYAQCLRSGQFSRIMDTSGGAGAGRLPLVALTSLEGLPRSQEVVVLGLVTEHVHTTAVAVVAASEEGRDRRAFTLEDARTTIPMVLSDTVRAASDGYFPCGGMYLARGTFDGRSFVVNSLSHPVVETREAGVAAVNGADTFGLAPPDIERAQQQQLNSLSTVVVVLAHVHLDDPRVMRNLETFFTKFETNDALDLSDIAVVLVGDFVSKPINVGELSHLDDTQTGRQAYQSLFDQLANMLHTKAPKVAAQSTLILVPGPHDPVGPPGIAPQPRLSAAFTERLRRWCPRVQFAPNPCRLRFFNHEIVISRHDYLDRLRKDPIILPDTPATFEHVAKTVIDQCNLLPAATAGIAWPNELQLRFFPLPHTLLLCDRTEQWNINHRGCNVINPGSFAATTTFLWYTPADGGFDFNSLEGTSS